MCDEVEKTCDQVAIVDQGEIVAMGSLDELRGGGQPRVLIVVDRESEALRVLADAPGVATPNVDDGVIHVTLTDGDAIPDLNRRLVEAGIGVRPARGRAGRARGGRRRRRALPP